MKTPEIKENNMPKAFETKSGRSFANVSSGRTMFSGRNSLKHDRSKISRNVHANIDFSELNEVCLDVGKVDLSHAARFTNELSPFKGSRETTGDYDLGRRPSKPLSSRSPLQYPLKKINEDEDWKGWDSKISFLRQQGCPVVIVKECSKVSHVLVMSEDLVDRECQILEKCNGFSCYRSNFEKHVLGENDVGGIMSVSEKYNEVKSKLCQYFADRQELDSFLQSMDCSVSLMKKKTNRQLNFSDENACHSHDSSIPDVKAQPSTRSCKLVSSQQCKGSLSNRGFHGFSHVEIVASQKRARKISDIYSKLKSACKSS